MNMLDVILDLKKAFKAICEKRQLKKYALTKKEWSILEQLLDVLKVRRL